MQIGQISSRRRDLQSNRCAPTHQLAMRARKDGAILMSFPRADSVYAMGKFNNWSTVATPLNKINEDQWELRVLNRELEMERLSFFVIERGARHGHVLIADPKL